MSHNFYFKCLNCSSFSLVELLIVVAIIGILVTMILPKADESVVRTKIAKVMTDFNLVFTAIQTYKLDYKEYPPNDWENSFSIPSVLYQPPIDLPPYIGEDPFAPQVIPKLEAAINPEDKGYHYHRIVYNQDKEIGPIEALIQFKSNKNKKWRIISRGPDLIYGYSDRPYDDLRDIAVPYDVSNGLYSRGNIIVGE